MSYHDRNRARWATADPYANPEPKRCLDCREMLPRSEFSTAASRADGLAQRCGKCHRLAGAAIRAANSARWLRENAYADPRPKLCNYCKQERPRADFSPTPTNADGLAGRCRGCNAARQAERNAKHRSQWVEYVDRDTAFRLARGVCYLCGSECDPSRWDLDHVNPISNGGEHSYANTAPTHPYCNLSKGAKTWPVVEPWDPHTPPHEQESHQ